MKDEYNCKDCINRGTEICENCVTTKYPSGRTSKPSHYQTKEEALLRIRVQTVPPIGIMPRHIHEERRADELAKAIIRYANSGTPIPTEWVAEHNELRLKNKPKNWL